MAKRLRCDEIVVQIIVREYDKLDRPIGEATTQPMKIFRSQARDVWALIDSHVKRLATQAPQPSPTTPIEKKKPRGKK